MSVDVDLVTMATGKYIDFVGPLVKSARKHLVGLKHVFVLTDQPSEVRARGAVPLAWGHLPWPLPTLLRYKAFDAYRSTLTSSGMLIYSDIDMLFVSRVEVPNVRGCFAVVHPGYADADRAAFPYERNPESAFAIPDDVGSNYFCGGIQGGNSRSYLQAATEISQLIDVELADGRVPRWHDESAWNWWLSQHPPEAVLDSSYCTPDAEANESSRILALSKDHARLRNLQVQQPGRGRTMLRKSMKLLHRFHNGSGQSK